MPDNILGSRVTGGSKPGIKPKPSRRSPPGMSYSFDPPPPIPPELLRDRVEIVKETFSATVMGFNIHLVNEGKTIYMSLQEGRQELDLDLKMVERAPKTFIANYRGLIIDTARRQLQAGVTMSTEDPDQDHYCGEAWMTPEQVAVLNDLRAECG